MTAGKNSWCPVTILLAILAVGGILIPFQASGREAGPVGEPEQINPARMVGLQTVPVPDLENLEKEVRNQLRDQKAITDEATFTLAVIQEQCAYAYLNLGEKYHAYEFFDAAESCYRNAIRLAPLQKRWNYHLAFLLQSRGRCEEALKYYGKVEEEDENARFLTAIREGECLLSLNRPREAKASFEKALKVNPREPSVLARMGEVLLEMRQYEESAVYLRDALAERPEANKLHYSLAMAHRGLGDREKAKEHLALMGQVGIQPPDPLLFILDQLKVGSRLQILEGKKAYGFGRFEDAIEAFEKAAEAAPDDPGARVNLGCALVKNDRFPEALNQFQQALALAPENLAAHYNLGVLLYLMDHYAESASHLQFVLEKSPGDTDAHVALAKVFMAGKRPDDALVHYRKAVAISPQLPEALLGESALLIEMNRHQEALESLEKAHENLPGNPEITHRLARFLATAAERSIRNGPRAVELATIAYARNPSPEYAQTLALAHAESGQCDAAANWQQTAINHSQESSSFDRRELDNMRNLLERFRSGSPCAAIP